MQSMLAVRSDCYLGSTNECEMAENRFTDVLVRTPEGWRITHVRAYTFIPLPLN